MIQDKYMDEMIKDIIEIFNMKGVELVRLSGLQRRSSLLAKMNIPFDTLENIIYKLKNAQLIKYEYITVCPHCGEKSYQIKKIENNAKLCDTCKTYYSLIKDSSLFL